MHGQIDPKLVRLVGINLDLRGAVAEVESLRRLRDREVRAVLEDGGVSERDVARTLGVSHSFVNRIRQGARLRSGAL